MVTVLVLQPTSALATVDTLEINVPLSESATERTLTTTPSVTHTELAQTEIHAHADWDTVETNVKTQEPARVSALTANWSVQATVLAPIKTSAHVLEDTWVTTVKEETQLFQTPASLRSHQSEDNLRMSTHPTVSALFC